MKRHIALLGILAAAVGGAPAQGAKEPQVLKPSTAWTVDYGPERCSLVRRFGGETGGVILQIDSYGSLANFRVIAVGDPIPKAKWVHGTLSFRLSADEKDRFDTMSLNGKSGKLRSVSFNAAFIPFEAAQPPYEELPLAESLVRAAEPVAPDPEFEAKVTGITLKFDNRRQLALATGTMAKPLAALRTCLENLYSSWGLDPAQQKALSRRPVPSEAAIKKVQQKYPTQALMGGRSAYVPVRLMVDAEGRPGACVVQFDNVEEQFRKSTCEGLARQFEPARDQAGNPVASVYHTSVIYLIG